MQIVTVNPFRCRVWNLHPRLDEHITEESCREQIESIEKHGQLVPALGRRLRGEPGYSVEVIYGARRLFVARHLNQPLLIELRDLSDRDALIAMDVENRLRLDISAYERAFSYARWLREGHFKSQDELAHALQMSAAHVSRSLRLASLPREIVAAFGSGAEICEEWGVELAQLLKESQQEQKLLRAAQRIAALSQRPPAQEIYETLRATGGAPRASTTRERVVKDDQGTTLFRVQYRRDSIRVVLPLGAISKASLRAIESSVARIMDAPAPSTLDS
ncbi:MAG: ParB/RepB/Spo0J family partition protein [Steroidobacteraceae bacterium]